MANWLTVAIMTARSDKTQPSYYYPAYWPILTPGIKFLNSISLSALDFGVLGHTGC